MRRWTIEDFLIAATITLVAFIYTFLFLGAPQ